MLRIILSILCIWVSFSAILCSIILINSARMTARGCKMKPDEEMEVTIDDN